MNLNKLKEEIIMLIRYYLKKNPKSKENLIKRKEIILTIGMSSLLAGIIFNRFFNEITIFDFLAGMFLGISMVMNITFLILWRVDKESKQ